MNLNTLKIVLIVSILAIGFFLRTYHLTENTKFSYDEARDSIAEYNILHGHYTLLGPDSKIGDKTIYFGPLHYYLMAPALAVSHGNPLGPYYWTALLGTLTILLIYILTGSLLASFFYAVFPIAVTYNSWAWNPNTIPLFTTVFLLSLKCRRLFLAGLFFGLALQLHFTTGALVIVLIFYKKFNISKSLKNITLLFLGISLALIPLILFELRHQFLYSNSIISLTAANWSYRSFNWHYFLWLLPLASVVISKLPKFLTAVIIIFSLIYTLILLQNKTPSFSQNPVVIEKIAKLIAVDSKKRKVNFNVASFVDPDTRATSYRYYLLKFNAIPLNADNYSGAIDLYVITFDESAKVLANQTYEIKSFRAKSAKLIGQKHGENVYLLSK